MWAFFNAVAGKAIIVVCSIFMFTVTGITEKLAGDTVPRRSIVLFAATDSVAADSLKAVKGTAEEAEKVERTAKKTKRKPVRISISDDGVRIGSDDEEVLFELDAEGITDQLEKALDGLEMDKLQFDLDPDEEERQYREIRGKDVVRFGQDIHIKKNEMVQGDVVAVMGDVFIEGKVRGNVVSVLGDVDLDSTAIVNGDVVSVLGTLTEDDDARIRGETISVGADVGPIRFPFFYGGFGGGVFKLIGKIVTFIIGVVLLLLIIYFLPARMERSSDYVFRSFFKSLGVGLLVILLGSIVVAILIAILSITIIGIPVAILIGLSFAALIMLGYFVSALALGRAVSNRLKLESDSPYIHGCLGLFLLALLGLMGALLSFTPLLVPLRYLLGSLGGFLNFLAVFTGTGAFIISKAGILSPEARPQLPE
ncbi:MAG: polymer-forming cytoskeletal protein [Candidatus Krumholzibacteriota bacterium]|nr:polymer-forming cytoskeletal protein [Candidatus Krumholzibacteriota bacterium]